MSSTQGNGEHWKSLESVGISRKELAMAEALQMEYDALSRLRHDKEESRTKQNADSSLISWDEPVLDFYSKSAGRQKDLKLLRGLSGSDPTLNYNSLSPQEGLPNHSTSQGSQPGPDPWSKGSPAGDYLYIFDGSNGGLSLSPGPEDTDGSSKKLSPPPLPPRVSIWDTPPLPPRKGSPLSSKISQPSDINTFSLVKQPPGKLLGRQILEEEEPGGGGPGCLLGSVDYDGINDAITRLNLKSTYDAEMLRDATRGWKEGQGTLDLGKDAPGKPVARSKTMPPQVPPRTYTSRYANRKCGTPGKNHRISAASVRTLLYFLCPPFLMSFRNRIVPLSSLLFQICYILIPFFPSVIRALGPGGGEEKGYLEIWLISRAKFCMSCVFCVSSGRRCFRIPVPIVCLLNDVRAEPGSWHSSLTLAEWPYGLEHVASAFCLSALPKMLHGDEAQSSFELLFGAHWTPDPGPDAPRNPACWSKDFWSLSFRNWLVLTLSLFLSLSVSLPFCLFPSVFLSPSVSLYPLSLSISLCLCV